jgi:hypothetical protein
MMRYKKLIAYLFLSSFVILVLGYIFTSSVGFNICTVTETITEASCINFYERLGDPLFYGGGALAIVFGLLYAFPQAFGAWRKFAIWFVPLATILFIFYPDPGSGDFLSPMPEQLFQWVSLLYIVISGIIIALTKSKVNN